MIEFRWVAFLTLWTLLIGPILDFAPSAPSGQTARAKSATQAKTKNAR